MVARFVKFGIQFSYPENWKLEEEQTQTWPYSVSVHAPGNAFWNVSVHQPGEDMQAAAEAVKEALEEEYDGIESNLSSEMIAEFEASGFDLYFYCLDMLVQTRIRAIIAGDLCLLIVYQAEDREFDNLNQVFSAISHDLLTNGIGQSEAQL